MKKTVKLILLLFILSVFNACSEQSDVYSKAIEKIPGEIYTRNIDGADISEDGDECTYSIALNRPPDDEVEVVLTPDSNITINGSNDPYTISFLISTEQFVTIGAVDDDIIEGRHEGTVSIKVSSLDRNIDGYSLDDILININDNDPVSVDVPSITVTLGITTFLENGGTGSFSVVLDTQPDGNVSIDISSSDTSEAVVNPPTITFSPADWNTVRIVNLTAVDDVVTDGDQTFDIVLTIDPGSTTDTTGYASLDPDDVSVTVLDYEIIFVDADAGGNDDGTSWADAYTRLQDAMAVAFPTNNIWVAEGAYYPDEGAGQTDNDRSSTFLIPSGVRVYGGFTGSETLLTERNWAANTTVLSGDLMQDDMAVGNDDNAYHVVYFSNVNNQTILDGFTITAGKGDSTGGGGIYNNGSGNGNSSNPQIANCIISGNFTADGINTGTAGDPGAPGAGMYNNGRNYGQANPTLINCTFSGNITGNGQTGVTAGGSGGPGSGMYNNGSDNGQSNPILLYCTFMANITGNGGDGGTNGGYGGPGSGMYNYAYSSGECSPILINCAFAGNSTGTGGNGGTLNGATGYGGGIYNTSSTSSICDPVLINCIFSGNSASSGGGMFNRSNNATSSSCPVFYNCAIIGNSAVTSGGGICNSSSMQAINSPIFINCIISGNAADNGGGICNSSFMEGICNPVLINCTISGNNAVFSGSGMYNSSRDTNSSSSPVIRNCIVWGNSAVQISNIISSGGIANPAYSFCDIEGSGGSVAWNVSYGTDNGNNIDFNPIFVNMPDFTTAPTSAGDLRLNGVSPCFDLGDNSALPTDAFDLDGDGNTGERLPFDLDGNDRVVNLIVDMGAYEN